jgi:hypothetical protein
MSHKQKTRTFPRRHAAYPTPSPDPPTTHHPPPPRPPTKSHVGETNAERAAAGATNTAGAANTTGATNAAGATDTTPTPPPTKRDRDVGVHGGGGGGGGGGDHDSPAKKRGAINTAVDTAVDTAPVATAVHAADAEFAADAPVATVVDDATSMDDFADAEQAAWQRDRPPFVWAGPVMMLVKDLMRSMDDPHPHAAKACMEQGLFAVGAACETESQFRDVAAYLTNDSLCGPYVKQLGERFVYSSMQRGFDTCLY